MKLNRESIGNKLIWKNYRLPTYDIAAVCDKTAKNPKWLHFGAGNIFRAFPAVLAQRLLTAGLADTGIVVCEGFDEELIDRVYREHDNLSVAVTLHSDGHIRREVVGSITESLKLGTDYARVRDIFCAPSLQMVTFTITEKAYYLRDLQMQFRPEVNKHPEVVPHESDVRLFINSFKERFVKNFFLAAAKVENDQIDEEDLAYLQKKIAKKQDEIAKERKKQYAAAAEEDAELLAAANSAESKSWYSKVFNRTILFYFLAGLCALAILACIVKIVISRNGGKSSESKKSDVEEDDFAQGNDNYDF